MKKLSLIMLSALTLMADTVPFVGYIEGFTTGGYIQLTKKNSVIYHECGGTMGCYTMPEWTVKYKNVTCIEGSCYKITKTKISLVSQNDEVVKDCDEYGYQYSGSLDCVKKIELIDNPYKNK